MFRYLPSIAYPPAGEGWWSPVTSTLNWCEEDYYATVYSAEIVNSLTNLMFVYLGYKGISNCVVHGHPRVYLVAFFSYTAIGVGSVFFHTTLKYPMQLVDELSMIYTTCVLFFAIFSHGQSKANSMLLLGFLVALALFITGYYHYLQDPLFHQNMFALLTCIVVFRSMYAMEKTLRPSRRTEIRNGSETASNGPTGRATRKEQIKNEERDRDILRTMWMMVACGVGSVALGFLIWNLDNIFCSTLRRWRREIGLPWGILLEGHGWWHIWTGIAAYFNIMWGIWLRYCLDGDQGSVQLVWPSLLASVPVVERRVKSKP